MARQVSWRPLAANKLARYSRLRWRSRSRGNTEIVLDSDCAKMTGRVTRSDRQCSMQVRGQLLSGHFRRERA
jgi:hypothetical protein